MKPLYSLSFTIFLFIFLILPFLLKSFSTELEIYPSVILPSGATKQIFKHNTTSFNDLILIGYDAKQKEQIINKEDFINPIPIHYISYIIDNGFGLSEKEKKSIKIRYLGNIEVKKKQISQQSKAVAKKWLSEKLKKLRMRDDSFLIRWQKTTIDLNTRKEILKQTIYEKTIFLL